MNYARLVKMRDGSLAYYSSYDPSLVTALKDSIPWQERRWNPDEKHWRVDAKHAQRLIDLSKSYLGVNPEIQGNLFSVKVEPELQTFQLEYLGTAKDRGGDEPTAYGWVNGDWNAIFPLSVLKTWFNIAVHDVNAPLTFYNVLGIKDNASGKEIKTAYRRAAKQYHPDVNKESDAKEQFQRINQAYNVLSNPLQRRKYDAGLAFEKTLPQDSLPTNELEKRGQWWYPPLRCGWLTAWAKSSLGRSEIIEIVSWQDIKRGNKTMVSYWPAGANHFTQKWI